MEEKQRENRKRIKVRLAFYVTSQDLVDMLQLGHSLVFRLFGCFVLFFSFWPGVSEHPRQEREEEIWLVR